MIYNKKISVDREIIKLIIGINREPATYSKSFIKSISNPDYPLVRALNDYGFIEVVHLDDEYVTFDLSDEGKALWKQIIAIARSDPRGKQEK